MGMNKLLIAICYFISGAITLTFMVGFSEGQPYTTKALLFLTGLALEIAKIRFTYLWALDNNNKIIAITSLCLISFSIFFSVNFTSNMMQNNREESKEITEEFKNYQEEIKDLDAQLKIIREEKLKLEGQQKEELKGVPKTWLSNRKEIKEYYSPLISKKDKEIETISDKKINLNKPNKYKYTIKNGFDPNNIRNIPVFGSLLKNVEDEIIIQIISILLGLFIEFIGVINTFLEGKKKKLQIKENEKDEQNKKILKEIEKLTSKLNEQNEQKTSNASNTQKVVLEPDEQTRAIKKQPLKLINFDEQNEQDEPSKPNKTSKQTERTEQTIKDYSCTSAMLQDYEYMENLIKFLVDFKGKKMPKKEFKEKFDLTESQYRKIVEYLRDNTILKSYGNGYQVI